MIRLLRLLQLTMLSISLAAIAACGGDSKASPDAGTPDSGTPPAIERAQAGGDPGAMTRVGNLAYITVGPRLTIWDLGDPGAPIMRGESEPFAAVLTGVAVLGTNAYVTDRLDLDGHLHVIDVSRPAEPKTLATIRLVADGAFSAPLGVAADATRVFVADQEHGVHVVDVSTPAMPKVSKTLGSGGVSGVQVVGTRLYAIGRSLLGTGFSLDAYDLGSADFTQLGSTSLAPGNGLTISPNHIAIGVGVGGLQVTDLTNMANPVDLLNDPAARVLSRSVTASATAAWVPSIDGLQKIDLVARPPVLSAPAALATDGANVASIDGNLLSVVTDRNQLLTIDVSAAAPAQRAAVNVTLSADAISVHAVGDRLFVASGSGGLRTARLHDLASLGLANPEGDTDFEDVVVEGDTAYVADWFFGLRIYDVSGLATPRLLGELDTPGAPSAIAYADHKIYLGESTNAGAVRVIDVSDASHPVELGAVPTSKVWDLQVVGNKVYTANESQGGAPGGLLIWDVSNPAAPTLAGGYSECEAIGVAVVGNTAVIGCGDEARVIDVSDPTMPRKVASWPVPQPGNIWAMAASGTRAYIGHDGGLIVIDVAHAAAPTLVSEKTTPYTVRGLSLPFAGRVVASIGQGGVFQWEIP